MTFSSKQLDAVADKPLVQIIRVMLATTLIGLALALCSCGDRPSGPTQDDAVIVHGTVYGWRCGVRDWANNSNSEWLRFSLWTGEKAEICFSGESGPPITTNTNDTSDYELPLEPGMYDVTVETGWTLPDTFHNVNIERDRELNFDIVYDILDPEMLNVYFLYPTVPDTMGMEIEWGYVNLLNGYLDQAFEISEGGPTPEQRDIDISIYGSCAVTYVLSIDRLQFHVIDVWTQGLEVLASDTSGVFPDNMSIDSPLAYICWD